MCDYSYYIYEINTDSGYYTIPRDDHISDMINEQINASDIHHAVDKVIDNTKIEDVDLNVKSYIEQSEQFRGDLYELHNEILYYTKKIDKYNGMVIIVNDIHGNRLSDFEYFKGLLFIKNKLTDELSKTNGEIKIMNDIIWTGDNHNEPLLINKDVKDFNCERYESLIDTRRLLSYKLKKLNEEINGYTNPSKHPSYTENVIEYLKDKISSCKSQLKASIEKEVKVREEFVSDFVKNFHTNMESNNNYIKLLEDNSYQSQEVLGFYGGNECYEVEKTLPSLREKRIIMFSVINNRKMFNNYLSELEDRLKHLNGLLSHDEVKKHFGLNDYTTEDRILIDRYVKGFKEMASDLNDEITEIKKNY